MRFRRAQTIILLTAVCLGSARCGGERSPSEPTPACSIAIAPASLTFASEGGTGGVTITAPAACTWSVTASVSWITLTAGSTGSGPGSVAYSVAPNPATESRSGSLTVGGQTHAVTQHGRPATVCTYDLSPGTAEFGKDAATGTFAVNAPGDCAWSATSNASWVEVTSGSQGSGSGSVLYAVARNADAIDRSATITVAGKTFTVRQAGDLGGCQYSVAPVAFSPCMSGGNLSATVITPVGCPWTVTTNASWLSIPSGSSGTGSGAMTITFSENYDARAKASSWCVGRRRPRV